MADFIDLEHLEPCDGTVEYIRLSFKRHRLDWALKTGRILKDKGYKIFINPVNCNIYTDEQYLETIEKVNELKPFAFSIVDTFGVMRLRDLTYRYSIVEKNLNPDIAIGLHLHENLGLAYSLAQQFIKIADPKRNIIIDGSLLGMGRVPGNLCIEQIMDHLNCEYGTKYQVEPVFDAIDDYIAPIKKHIPWGYAIPYSLSAKYNLHRTYAEYLMNKWKLRTSDIERILPQVSQDEGELFNEDYIEGLYRDYMSIETDDTTDISRLKNELKDRDVLLIAPGANINRNKDRIKAYYSERHPVVNGIQCIPDFVPIDYEFYTNIKRLDVLRVENSVKQIYTSNLCRYVKCGNTDGAAYVVNYSSLAYHDGDYCDDSVLMFLSLLKRVGVTEFVIAGFDGVRDGKGDFYLEALSRNDRPKDYSDAIKEVLEKHYSDVDIRFLTESYYDSSKNDGIGKEIKSMSSQTNVRMGYCLCLNDAIQPAKFKGQEVAA